MHGHRMSRRQHTRTSWRRSLSELPAIVDVIDTAASGRGAGMMKLLSVDREVDGEVAREWADGGALHAGAVDGGLLGAGSVPGVAERAGGSGVDGDSGV